MNTSPWKPWQGRRPPLTILYAILLITLCNIVISALIFWRVSLRVPGYTRPEQPDRWPPTTNASEPQGGWARKAVDMEESNVSRPDCDSNRWQELAGSPPCDDFPRDPSPGHAQVALMFLIRDKLPTEPIWTAFFTSAAELRLKRPVRPTRPKPMPSLPPLQFGLEADINATCWHHGGRIVSIEIDQHRAFVGKKARFIKDTNRWLQGACSTTITGQMAYQTQDLFNVYMHRVSGASKFPPTSAFAGRDINETTVTEFAQPSLVTAALLLLKTALAEPRNTMFVLLSESCIPLHHPALVWTQLVSESHLSRVKNDPADMYRWSSRMSTNFLSYGHFRKSTQWFSLTRRHAQLAVDDAHVWPLFQAYCRTQESCGYPGQHAGHLCIADEHYFATMLQAYDQGNLTSQTGKITYSTWQVGSWHPISFGPGNVTLHLLQLRGTDSDDLCERARKGAAFQLDTVFTRTSAPMCKADGNRKASVGLGSSVFDSFTSFFLGDRRSSSSTSQQQQQQHHHRHASHHLWHSSHKSSKHSSRHSSRRRLQAAQQTIEAVEDWDGVEQDLLATFEEPPPDGVDEAAANSAATDVEAGVHKDTRALLAEVRNTEPWDDAAAAAAAGDVSGGVGRSLQYWGVHDPAPTRFAMLRRTYDDMWRSQRLHSDPAQRHAWEDALLRATVKRMRESGWLGDYQPMPTSCPLFGRKVVAEAVGDFAAMAWRCDGLGFAWDCLKHE